MPSSALSSPLTCCVHLCEGLWGRMGEGTKVRLLKGRGLALRTLLIYVVVVCLWVSYHISCLFMCLEYFITTLFFKRKRCLGPPMMGSGEKPEKMQITEGYIQGGQDSSKEMEGYVHI